MTPTIIHFGVDQRDVLSTLTLNGYAVNDCGNSLPKLNLAIRWKRVDAVAVSENGIPFAKGNITAACWGRSVPSILFQEQNGQWNATDFDLVISPHLPTNSWLKLIGELIEHNRAIRAASKTSRDRSVQLRGEAASLREKSTATRVMSQYEISRGKQFITTNSRSFSAVSSSLAVPQVLIVDDFQPW